MVTRAPEGVLVTRNRPSFVRARALVAMAPSTRAARTTGAFGRTGAATAAAGLVCGAEVVEAVAAAGTAGGGADGAATGAGCARWMAGGAAGAAWAISDPAF